MNKYILMLGVAGVALGSYCAYAGNSATMTVTATIAHDVSLDNVTNLSLGTITINPGYTGFTGWNYDDSGEANYFEGQAIVSISNATFGTFTANIPNPSACTGGETCGGLRITGNEDNYINNLFGGSDESNYCGFRIKYGGLGSIFKVITEDCSIGNVFSVTTGAHSGTLHIEYSPS